MVKTLMLRVAAFLGVSAFLAIIAQAAFAGPVLERVRTRGLLVAAVSDGFPPVAFFDPATGKPEGFDVDVTRAVAERLGVKLKLITPAWDLTVSGRWGDRFDLAVGSMTPTRARKAGLAFPAIYYRVPVSFAVHNKATGLQTASDLAGKRVGICSSCSTQNWLNNTLDLDEPVAPGPAFAVRQAVYEGEGLSFDDLRLGPGVRLDAVLANRPTLEAAIAKGYPFRILEPPAFYEPLAVAVDRGDPDFSAVIARTMADLHADGTLSRLSRKWFGADLTIEK